VHRSIDFDREFRGGAIEVEHVRTERVLTADFVAEAAGSDGFPQDDLGRRHVPPEAAGAQDSVGSTLHMATLSAKEQNGNIENDA
jgi:hypothetical protein